jgi:predicted glycoside hydrolase/deacetylase ChbG (UPF0249 family)
MSATADTARERTATGNRFAGRVLWRGDVAARSVQRRIVLHADDLGMNAAVTDGIVRGFDDGLLTSTSLLSNAPDAERALHCWRQLESRRRASGLESAARRRRLDDLTQSFDLGVHLNLTQGRPLIGARYPAELLNDRGHFPGILGFFRRLRHATPSAHERIEEELACQVQFMLDRGHQPTHINGHQYIELLPSIGRIVESLLQRYHIPVARVAWEPSWRTSFLWPRISAVQWMLGGVKKYYAGRFKKKMHACGKQSADAFFGTMTAGTTISTTIGIFLSASRGSRLTEIGLHPAFAVNDRCTSSAGWQDPLAALRPKELDMIVSTDLEDQLVKHDCGLGRLI